MPLNLNHLKGHQLNGQQRQEKSHKLNLPLWQRFSFRMSATFGCAMLIIVCITACWAYQVLSERHVAQVQTRLLTLVTAISQTLDVAAIHQAATEATNEQGTLDPLLVARLNKQFETIVTQDTEIHSIYILLPTNTPNLLSFFVDYSEGEMAKQGELYDATDVPVMLQGFSAPMVEDQPYEDSFGVSLSAYAPLKLPSGQTVGLVGVDVMLAQLQAIHHWLINMIAWIAFSIVCLVVVLSLWIGRWVQKPLGQVVEATASIAEGSFDVKSAIERNDEFGWLGHQIDQMAAALKDRELIRATFGRYVSKKLAGALLENGQVPDLGGQELVVTILFSDLKSYTSLSEFLSPSQILKLLNEYFGAMNEIVDAYRGCVIEFLGDGMMVVFGAPVYDEDHADHAVGCALEMQAQLKQLNKHWQANGLARLWQGQGLDAIEMRIGIHSGPVVAGNMGSQSRMKYGVIGDSVNVAARLEHLNQQLSTSILISEAVKSSLSLQYSESLKNCGSHCVKGRHREVQTYTLAEDYSNISAEKEEKNIESKGLADVMIS